VVTALPEGAQIVYPAPDLTEVASELLDQLDQIEDDDGRPIWLTASEVELDQWVARVTSARGALRDRLPSADLPPE
jgi:hypothetical protein